MRLAPERTRLYGDDPYTASRIDAFLQDHACLIHGLLEVAAVSAQPRWLAEALRLAEAFRANVIDANTSHFVFELTGRVSKIEQFISIMKPLGLIEVCRTGVAAVNRGPEGM